jgi:hypothetical protein
MKSLSLFKAAVAATVVSLLAACGGGGDTAAPATPLPPVAWASPAAFVTPGASSKSFALTGCYRTIYDDDEEEYIEDEVNLYKASLVIASNGDMSILAATTATGTVTAVWSKAFADARNVSWSVSGSSQTPSYSLMMGLGTNNFEWSIYVDGSSLSTDDEDYNTDIETSIECEMTDKLALQINPDQARAAKNLGTAAGVTTYDNDDADGRIEGGNAFWNYGYGSPEYDFMRFNLATGELSSSTSSTGTYSPISLALPSGSTENGSYGESISRFNSSYDFKEAKSICLSYSRDSGEMMNGKYFNLYATAYGNKFNPRGSRDDDWSAQGFESPQYFDGGCNQK